MSLEKFEKGDNSMEQILRNSANYRDFLKSVLSKRMAQNSRYSMRAMARDLNVSASRLSQILQGKQGISQTVAEEISEHLALDEKNKEYFLLLTASSDARNKRVREEAKLKIKTIVPETKEFVELEGDQNKMLENPFHYALFELLCVGEVKHNTEWLAKKLGRTENQIQSSLTLLQRLKLVQIRNGKYVANPSQLTTSDGVSSKMIRNFNKAIIREALKSIEEQDVSERNISTLTIGVHKKDLEKYFSMISKFRRELNKFSKDSLSNSGLKAEEIYCLSTQFFRITKKVDEQNMDPNHEFDALDNSDRLSS